MQPFQTHPPRLNRREQFPCIELDGELAGRAKQDHLAVNVELLHGGFGSTSNCHARNTDEIVATCVSDPGQRVHLGVDTEDAAPLAVCVGSYPSGFEQVVPLNDPSLRLQELRVHVMGIAGKRIDSASRHRV